MSEKRNILKNAGIVGLMTLLSRFTGLIRDSVMAAQFGASGLHDSFLVAFEIPNLIRRVMGEGALSAFMVPLLVKRRSQGGEGEGWRFFNLTANFLLLVALVISLLGMAFSHEVYMAFGGAGQFVRGRAAQQAHTMQLTAHEVLRPHRLIELLPAGQDPAGQDPAGQDPAGAEALRRLLADPQGGGLAGILKGTAPLPKAETAQAQNDMLSAMLAQGLNRVIAGAPLIPPVQADLKALSIQLSADELTRPGPDVTALLNRRLLEAAFPDTLSTNTRTLIVLGTRYTRIMFPYAIGLTLAALMMGACHALRDFMAASAGSVMLNLTIIAVGGVGLALGSRSEPAALWMCWAVLAGAALRVALMVPPLLRHGWRWRPVLSLHDPDMFRLLKMMGLGVLGMTVGQLNIIVTGFFALSLGEGMKVFITYANRLIQFPMALTATAVATAMLPQLSQFLLEKRHDDLREMMAFVKRIEIVLMMPATLGLMFLGLPIVELIFQRVNWTAQASIGSYWALVFYAPGLLPMGWARILVQLSYARQDLMTPLKAATWGIAVNIVLNWLLAFHTPLARHLPQAGLAIAFSIGVYVNYWVLARAMKRELGDASAAQARIGETMWKSGLAALIACALGAGIYFGAVRWLGAPQGSAMRAAWLLPVIAGVGAVYFLLAHALRVPDSDRAAEMVMRKLRRRA